MLRVLRFLKPYRKRFILAILLFFVQTVCSLFMPYVMSNIVNNGVALGDMDYILRQSLVMIGLTVFSILCAVFAAKISSYVTAHFVGDMQKGIFTKINSLTFEEFGRIGSGSLLTRSTEDVMVFMDMSTQVIHAVATFPVMFFGGVILSLQCDVVLALILLVSAPLILCFVRLISRNMHSLWKTSDEYCDLQNKVVRERLTGLRVIRAFDKEEHEHERISDATRTMAHYIINANVRAGALNPVSVMLLNLATVVMLYAASSRIQTETLLTAGDVVAVIQYVTLILSGIMVMSWTFVMMPQIKVRGGRIAEVLDLAGTLEGADENLKLDGDIELKDVTFQYDGSEAPVLTDINMRIKKGEVIGIIGGTGSGKSTIVKLLLHFYTPTKGSISMGGKPYSEMSRTTTRANISVALQKGTIFGTTVAENVRMGNKDATDEQIKDALDIAQMTEFIESHEEGIEYELLQAGNNISGGQKQRINIARTIIKPASLYIFDDSFSALDYLTESKLRKVLNERLKGSSQVVITQRAATAMRCDRIYVIDCGRIVGEGTHKELLENCSIYKEIYDSQLGAHMSGKEAV